MKKYVDECELEDKDCLVVIGSSRAGKGTLLSALMGADVKFVDRAKAGKLGVTDKMASKWVMVPTKDGKAITDGSIISHQSNSHTFVPTRVAGPS